MQIIDPIRAFFCIDFWFSLGQKPISNRKTGRCPVTRVRSLKFSHPAEDAALARDETKLTQPSTLFSLPAPPNTSSSRELLEERDTPQ